MYGVAVVTLAALVPSTQRPAFLLQSWAAHAVAGIGLDALVLLTQRAAFRIQC